jgi:hypothetical protein
MEACNWRGNRSKYLVFNVCNGLWATTTTFLNLLATVIGIESICCLL